MIDRLGGVLLISQNAPKLRDFYRDILGLNLSTETHEGVPEHYECDLGNAHLAIHPAAGWPGVARDDAQSPVVLLETQNVQALVERLRAAGYAVPDAVDHGFAFVVAFRDPDGNLLEVLQPK